jgi:Uma2 family endonuclease
MQRTRGSLALEEFSQRPDIDEKPYREFIGGRVEAKTSAQKKPSTLQQGLVARLDAFAVPRGIGEAYPELRRTFADRSIVPDVAFLVTAPIAVSDQGEVIDETFHAPDLPIAVRSPDQTLRKQRGRIAHSLAHGCALGRLIDPHKKTIEVHRPGATPERRPAGGVLTGEPVLPGFRLPAAEVFGWLVRARPQQDPEGA